MTLRSALRYPVAGIVAGALLCGCNLGLSQSAVLVDADSSSGNTQSIAPFTVTGPWQIKYTFDCTKENAEQLLDSNQFTIDVFNGDDNSTSAEHPQTTFIAVRKQGTLSFSTAGDYYAHIDTQCDWTLQVIDLSGGPVVSASSPPRIAQPHGVMPLDVTFAAVFGNYNCDLTGTSALLCQVGDGTGSVVPFGALAMHRTAGLQGGTAACTAAATVATLTAADGDVLTVQSTKGQACKKTGADTFTVSVTSGTGIFHGVTGTGTIRGQGGASDEWTLSLVFPQ